MGSALLDAVKGACLPGVWSRGVELARAEAVTGVEEDDDRVELRVVERGGLISRTVELLLDDLTWDCTCGTRPVCAHVAAAAIAFEAAREEGRGLPRPTAARGRLLYRFLRETGGLALQRAIEAGDRAVPFEATLAALAAGRVAGMPLFESTQADLAVERALGTHRRGPLPRGLVAPVLTALRRVEGVTVEGTPVRADPTPWLPTVVVEDAPGGFLVRLLPRADAQVFANGMAVADGALRPTGDPLLTPQERTELPRGRFVPRTDVAPLTHDWIPSLRKRGLPVDVHTDRLPGVERLPLRVALDLTPEGISVSALATLVYGEPPHARVDPGGLVHLQGALPVRDEVAEA
ncbi:MAG TPA: SWIM zinc finger family protein, partial [Candidatus Polarisedimenticolaceae bacterium]|nr:SWIM zinc finger family protein [Candidatus Polarisedimenticolaceae bacterium]